MQYSKHKQLDNISVESRDKTVIELSTTADLQLSGIDLYTETVIARNIILYSNNAQMNNSFPFIFYYSNNKIN
jgi:hypothetical protein